MYFNIVFLSSAYKSTKNIVLFCIYYIFYLIKIFNCIYHYLLCVKLYLLFCDVRLLIDFVVTRKKTDVQIGHLFRNHSLNEFSVLHTLEIVTFICIPDYQIISTLSKYRIRISAQFSIPSLVVSRIM